jgi:protein TonB
MLESAQKRMARASVMGTLLWAFAFALCALAASMHESAPAPPRTVVIRLGDWVAPPPLVAVAPPLGVTPAAPRKAAAAAPLPVPDEQAAPSATIEDQGDPRRSTPGMVSGPGAERVVVTQPPLEEAPPEPGAYVYFEELPELVRSEEPAYPEIAKAAGVEGRVFVYVLVGKDGRVLDARIDPKTSVPMLDEAALAAARTCVFKPALASGRPVAVWVTKPYNFKLR